MSISTLTSAKFAAMIEYEPEQALEMYRAISDICESNGIEFISLNELVKYVNQCNPEFREIVDSVLLQISNKF